jgi:hypothetical protein
MFASLMAPIFAAQITADRIRIQSEMAAELSRMNEVHDPNVIDLPADAVREVKAVPLLGDES